MASTPPANDAPLLQALIDLAGSQITGSLARASNLDMQALGLIGFDGALVALVVAVQRHPFGPNWWLPIPGLAVSILAAASVLWGARIDLGPTPSDFYERFRGAAGDEPLAQLLSDLVETQRRNAEPLRQKAVRLVLGAGLLLLTIVYSGLAIAL